MPDSYLSCEIVSEDDKETRRKKLYLGIVSIGEQLYSIGAAVAEQQKQLNRLEKQIADMRREYDLIKSGV